MDMDTRISFLHESILTFNRMICFFTSNLKTNIEFNLGQSRSMVAMYRVGSYGFPYHKLDLHK